MGDGDPTHAGARAHLFADYQPRRAGVPQLAPPERLLITGPNQQDVAGIAHLIALREEIAPQAATERALRWLAASAEVPCLVVARIDRAVVGYGRVVLVRKAPDHGGEPVPEGWYLMGVIVAEAFRRQGIAAALTRHRLAWIATHSDEAFYFANSKNLASIDLHRRFGFLPVRQNFIFPGATFSAGGTGVLFRVDLSSSKLPPW